MDKPVQVIITDGSGNPGSGNPFSLSDYQYNVYGNLTTETKCITISGSGNGATCGSSYSQTTYQPDTHGQVTSKREGANVTSVAAKTQYTWTGPAGQTDSYNGYLTTVTYPNSAKDQYTYSSYTGQVESHTDWNSQTTTYSYSDSLNRLTSIVAPLGDHVKSGHT